MPASTYFGSGFSPKGVPLLLWLGMYWCALIGAYILVAAMLLPFGVNVQGFAVNDVPVSAREFFSRPVGFAFIPAALIFLVIAYALFTRRGWSRTLIFSMSVALAVLAVFAAFVGRITWLDAALTLLWPLGIRWYLYSSDAGARYYRMLQGATAAPAAGA